MLILETKGWMERELKPNNFEKVEESGLFYFNFWTEMLIRRTNIAMEHNVWQYETAKRNLKKWDTVTN